MVIQLDKTDRKILTYLDLNSRQPISQLARKVGKSRETVSYRIRRLEERGIIAGYLASINPNAMGYEMYKVYLQLESVPSERSRFYEYLKGQPDIYWLGISDGVFDCVFAILSQDITEYYERISEILSEFKDIIIRKVLGKMVDTKQYSKRFLHDMEGQHVTFGGKTVANEVDTLSRKLLGILANEANCPLAELARRTDTSIEMVRSRMRTLESQGIILGYRIALDLNKLGLEFFKAIIYFNALSRSDEAALSEWMLRHPKSLYYIRSMAPWEVELEFAVENYQEFNRIINAFREQFAHAIRNHEHLIMIYETWMPGYHGLFEPAT